MDNGKIREYLRHNTKPRQRVGTLLYELCLAIAGDMARQNVDVLRACHEIHGAADSGNRIFASLPVGNVAILGHLERAQDRQVDMAATDHRKAVRMVEESRARYLRNRLLARIDEVEIFLALGRRLTEAENAVLAVIDHGTAFRHELRRHLRNADAEVHIGTIFNVL